MSAHTLFRKLLDYSLLAVPRTLDGYRAWQEGPPKTLVVIASTMRAGSTLLKALLAEADDISHLPEVDFSAHSLNRYYFYGMMSRLSAKPVVLLKKPRHYRDRHAYPRLPRGLDIRVIALVRHPIAVARSVIRMEQARGKANPGIELKEAAVLDYWFETYERMAVTLERMHYPVKVVQYEKLVAEPERLTRELFEFSGSARRTGVTEYHKPDYEWQWGLDDGGSKIRELQVLKSQAEVPPEDIIRLRELDLERRYTRVVARLQALQCRPAVTPPAVQLPITL